MAVALDDATIAKLGPSAREQIRALQKSGAGGGTSEKRRRRNAEQIRTDRAKASYWEARAAKANAPAEPKTTPIEPKYGPSDRVRAAASATRAGWRFAGSGKPNTGQSPTVRGVLWLFVWIGVLFYLVANPSTLPRLVHLVFA